MNFISYSQNLEDVMLWRALKHIENGFYIDVGAGSPTVDSVTKAFYDRGWRGINIEPDKLLFAELSKDRVEDTNLNLVASSDIGETTIYELGVVGWKTMSKEIADQRIAQGYQAIEEKVTSTRLERVCVENDVKVIHFLKIDVEGFENQVINGMNFDLVRPWIILVEAIDPVTQEDRVDWEDQIISEGYQLCHWDGLNRFYLANEHSNLLSFFKTGPNLFDNFTSLREHLLNNQLSENTKRFQALADKLSALSTTVEKLSEENEKLSEEKKEIKKTRSANYQLEFDKLKQATLGA